MAALVVNEDFDLGALRRTLAARLPAYALPSFVRIVPAIELTGTFKLKKHALAQQGYDPRSVTDDLYVDDTSRQEYVRLDLSALRATAGRGAAGCKQARSGQSRCSSRIAGIPRST